MFLGFPDGSAGKKSACNVGDLGSILALGRSPGEGKGLPTPVFWPGESHELYIVHGSTKSQIQLSDFHFTFVTCSKHLIVTCLCHYHNHIHLHMCGFFA